MLPLGLLCPHCRAPNESHARKCAGCGGSLTDPGPGSLIASRYEVLRALGRGGMGTVYQARDRMLDEVVAVKVIRSDLARGPGPDERFRSEIRLARKVTHRNVCRMQEYGEDGELRYISMEFVDGTDLRQLLRKNGPPPPGEACRLAIQTAEGLEAIHDVGIIHRDLKTANVMRDAQGLAKIMDFGIAKQYGDDLRSGLTATGQIIGTPEYMSPEQIRGEEVDFRSDLYSLGIVIYEIFTGRVPFCGDTPMATILKHLGEPPLLEGPAVARMPAAMRHLVRQALAKDRAERHPSARAFLHDLREQAALSFPPSTPWSSVRPVASEVAAEPSAPEAEDTRRTPGTAPPCIHGRPSRLPVGPAEPTLLVGGGPGPRPRAGPWRRGSLAVVLILATTALLLVSLPRRSPVVPVVPRGGGSRPDTVATLSSSPPVAPAAAAPAAGPPRPVEAVPAWSQGRSSPARREGPVVVARALEPQPGNRELRSGLAEPARGGQAVQVPQAPTSFVHGPTTARLPPVPAAPPGMGAVPPGIAIKPAETGEPKVSLVIEIEPPEVRPGDAYVLRYFLDNRSPGTLHVSEAFVQEVAEPGGIHGGQVDPLAKVAPPHARALLFEARGWWPHQPGSAWRTILRVALLDGSVYSSTLEAR